MTAVQSNASGVLAAPRRRPLAALYAANAISRVGDILMFVAVPWFVLQTTGSVTQTGITAFFTTGAVAFSALFGSALVDRLGFRRASVASDVASCAGVALIPLLYETVGLPFWGLLALVFVAGLLTTPGATARAALTPDLARMAGMRLERASAMTDGIGRLAGFIGAPLAGVLIALVGASNLLWVDAATFAASAALIGLAVPARPPAAHADGAGAEPPEEPMPGEPPASTVAMAARGWRFAGMREGVAFIWRDPVLRSITLVVLVTNLLDAGNGAVLMPAFVKEVFGDAVALGALIAAFGGAAFAGALTFGAIGHRLPRRPALGVGFTLGGATRFFWIVTLAPALPAMLAAQALCGFCIGPVNPLFSTLGYERVPVAARARVFGAITAGAMLGAPLGGLLAGAVVPLIGIRGAMLAFGVVYSLATVSLLLNPALRGLDAGRAGRDGSAPAPTVGR